VWIQLSADAFVSAFIIVVHFARSELGNSYTVHDGRTILYRTSLRDCGSCPIKPKCCPKAPQRKIPRDLHEDARDHVRTLMGTPEFDRSRDERKKVEMRFAHLKTPIFEVPSYPVPR
jgi:Transposase DDE domain